MLMTPVWMRDKTPDKDHFYRRLFTAKHRAKKNKIKFLWIFVLSLCLVLPSPHVIFALVLLTTFISFSWLDESN